MLIANGADDEADDRHDEREEACDCKDDRAFGRRAREEREEDSSEEACRKEELLRAQAALVFWCRRVLVRMVRLMLCVMSVPFSHDDRSGEDGLYIFASREKRAQTTQE